MNVRTLSLAILSAAALSALAYGRQPINESPTSAAPNDYSIEIFDQNKTIKIPCNSLGFSSHAIEPGHSGEQSNDAESKNLSCETSIDASTVDISDFVSKGKRLERVLGSIRLEKGPGYKIELLNAVVTALDITANDFQETPRVAIEFSSAKGRLVRNPE